VLVARSVAEAHLYLDLEGCDRAARRHRLVAQGDGLASVYECTCGGQPRTFTFRIDAPEPAEGLYGDAQPSSLIGPGAWLEHADRLARSVPASPDGLSDADRAAARLRVTEAAECVAEVLKFVPAGAEGVPEGAFRTDAERAVLQREPGRFRAQRLEAVLHAYRKLTARF
jgi:hypothetical protein